MLNYRERIFKGLAVVMSILIIATSIGCTNQNINNNAKTSRKEYQNINRDGSFVVKGRNGIIKVDKDFTKSSTKDIKQIEWYSDAYCPDCMRAHGAASEYINESITNGDMEVKFHILNFLPYVTDNNEYSLDAAAWLIGIAENYPTRILKAIDIFYTDTFKERFKESTKFNEDIKEYLINEAKLLNEKEAELIYNDIENLENTVNRGSVGIRRNKELKELSPDEEKRVFVPFIYNIKDKEVLDGENEDAETHILKRLKGMTGCKEDCN